ncbi:substrate-binding domain-containing protein [Streptomyces monashensis]|uniref:LysR family transcriptional regulator n=1 Tax=Streptomyces monashensis TaxID=1678012 RepID=A0A1S2QIQ9_9ACTN|nr:substrate-binding domain-containing protein [Streptomyces monashensis]OIK06022.1 LysR family transcriptional regulator [Streptomyces monashensis]
MLDHTPTATDVRVIRFGYHGSPEVAHHITRLAGRDRSAVRLSAYDVTDPFRDLRAGELDLMIVKFGLREPDLVTSRVLTEDARAVLVGAAHPLAARASVSVEELADYDTFARPGAFPDYVWDDVVPPRTPAGRPIRRNRRVGSIPEMMALVAEGEAVHISLVSLADVAPPAVRVVPIHDLPSAPVTVAWRRGTELPFHVRDFITTAEAEASR